jgi:hypothetical protein
MPEAATLPGWPPDPSWASAPSTLSTALPATPVGRQLEWVCDAATRRPIGATELQAHVASPLLESDHLDAVLGRLAGANVDSYRAQPRSTNRQAYALLGGAGQAKYHLRISTDAAGRIAALDLTPVPGSWPEIGDRLRALAPRASFLAAEIDAAGRVRPVYGVAPSTPRPIGSAIFLYVLGALAHAIGQGRASWDEPLAVRDAWKADLRSPVGAVPDGAMLTLRQYADDAIFYGDSSAIDHLLGRLGRGAVEAQQVRFGHAQVGANLPFLTTREMTQLKLADYPRLGQGYVATDGPRARLGYLRDVVARLPRPAAEGWPVAGEPRFTDSVEWFAAPGDVTRAFLGLSRQAAELPAVGDVLAQQGTAALGLDARRWPVGWSMGGAEPGVVSENFLAKTAGRTFVVSMMVSDPERPLDLAATRAELLAAGAGAFELLAH